MKDFTIKIDFEFDLKFWAFIPAFNLNLHSKSIEFEWLCVGIYASAEFKN